MSIDKNKVQTQEETGEPAPVDQVEKRVEAEMELIEGRAKERVAQGMQDKKLEEEAHREEEDALKKLHEKKTD